MGKSRDGKVPILPSTTRRGTVLNTSTALDSPSVLSKFLTPPHTHATHTATMLNLKLRMLMMLLLLCLMRVVH